MRHSELLETLQKLIFRKPTQQELADILGCQIGVISARASRDSKYKFEELIKIEKHYNISFVTENNVMNILDIIERNENEECFDIKYWEELPENLKRAKVHSVHTDREIIENDWQLKHENIRVIPMKGNSLQNYWYPMRHNHILAFDITNKDLNNDGVFVFTTNNGENIYIRKLNLLFDGNINIVDYTNPEPVIVKTVSPERAKEVDMQIIGRVFKNISLRI